MIDPAPHPVGSQSRRRFLGTSAVAGMAIAASSAVPRTVFAYQPQPVAKAKPRLPLGPDETMKMAIIGTGGMGTGHCESFATLAKNGKEKMQIVAICDVNDLHAAHAKEVIEKIQPGISVEVYKDHRKLLERKDLHGVLIATPEHWHCQIAIDAILSGRDVYCEKPMTINLADALRLREVCKGNPDIILQVGTQYAALPKFAAAQKLIDSGEVGLPIWSQTGYCRNTPTGEWNYYGLDDKWKPGVNLDWDTWCGPMGKQNWDPKVYIRWRRYRKYSTGIIGDLLVHKMTPFFVALNSVGWPTKVTALGAHMVDKEMENHDMVNLTVQFESGHNMIVAGNTNNELGLEDMIRCQKGNIYLSSRHCVVRPESKFTNDVEQREIQCEDVGNDQDQHRINWVKCMRTRTQPLSDIEQGTKVMVVVDLATRSLWDGGTYTYDPKTTSVKRL
ncbi:MAG: Gfo/Idh/MocA family oxidoreductase [Pyrinomonadaceae bacterium]|nr:Gfo/Idh/MocA family oxidoreductase [Phycisphaerales bacterium]